MWKFLPIFILFSAFSEEVTLVNQDYKVVWDSEHKIPIQTQHRLQPHDDFTNVTNKQYLKDSRVDGPAPNSFFYSNYDRGHMVPSADMRHSLEGNRQTYLITNIAPQRPQLNRFSWARLEKEIRRQEFNQHQNRIEVVTGVLGLNSDKLNNGVSIPKAFYKVIYNHGNKRIRAYILPNDSAGKRLSQYEVSIDKIEQLTNQTFFEGQAINNPFLTNKATAFIIVIFIGITLCLLRLKKHGLTI